METRTKASYLEKLRCKLKFNNLFVVPRKNRGGGLALLWMNDLNLHIRTFSPRHIDAVINPGIDDAWRFTGFYRAPEVANREDSWLVLRHLPSQFNLPWVCIGDFNEIAKIEEKSGGAIRPKKQMQDFRALALADWILKFPSSRLHHLQDTISGSRVEGEDQIGALLTRYYSSLFTSGNPTQLDPVLNVVETRVLAEMNAELLNPFAEAEGVSDKQVWLPSNNGEFTTRSAYHLLAGQGRNLLPSSSSGSGNKQVWKSIWNLQVPHKVKHLMWRAANDALPNLHNLWRRKVVTSTYCPFCKSDGEDMVHALWSCRRLLEIWEDDSKLRKCSGQKFLHFADLLAYLFMGKNCLDIDLLAVIKWLIWGRRNAARRDESILEYHQIRSKAEVYLLDFKTAQKDDRRVAAATTRAPRWIPPIPNHFKINFYGAVFSELNAAGLGVVIRDSCGRVVGALAERIPIPTSAAIVEALACRRALIFAKELNLMDTVFEGDAKQIIKALLAKEVHQPENGHVLEDSLVLASDFRVSVAKLLLAPSLAVLLSGVTGAVGSSLFP
nr:putative ribonuclease h protein [Quercus suber]